MGRCLLLLETLLARSEVLGTHGLASHRSRLRASSIDVTW